MCGGDEPRCVCVVGTQRRSVADMLSAIIATGSISNRMSHQKLVFDAIVASRDRRSSRPQIDLEFTESPLAQRRCSQGRLRRILVEEIRVFSPQTIDTRPPHRLTVVQSSDDTGYM